MQNIVCYVSAEQALGTVRDFVNAKNATAPTIVRGFGLILHLRLFANSEGAEPYDLKTLQAIDTWSFIMDDDWSGETTPKIIADNSNITVSSVTGDDGEYTYTDIAVPILETNTEEVLSWLGDAESRSGLHAQLTGYSDDAEPIFILQIKNFTVRNRLDSAGEPTAAPSEYLTEAQVRALINASGVVSINGKTGVVKLNARDVGATPLMNMVESFEGGHLELYCEPGNYYWIHDVQILMVNITDPASLIESVILVELSTEDDGGGSISFPAGVQWVGEPEFEPGKTYLISIVNNIAVAAEVTV